MYSGICSDKICFTSAVSSAFLSRDMHSGISCPVIQCHYGSLFHTIYLPQTAFLSRQARYGIRGFYLFIDSAQILRLLSGSQRTRSPVRYIRSPGTYGFSMNRSFVSSGLFRYPLLHRPSDT